MGVDKSRQDGASAQIDALGACRCQVIDFVLSADGEKASARDGDGRSLRIGRVNGVNVAVI